MFYFLLSFMVLLNLVTANQNLVCKGDFEDFRPTIIFDGEKYQRYRTEFRGGQPYCWFNQNTNDVYEIKNKIYPKGTVTAELINLLDQYVLCQIIQLEIGATYFFSFDTLTPKSMRQTITRAKLNNNVIVTVRTVGAQSFSSGSFNFTADRIKNTLCFQAESNWVLFSVNNGPCIDNVTIIKTSNVSNSEQNVTSPGSGNEVNETIPQTVETNVTNQTVPLQPEQDTTIQYEVPSLISFLSQIHIPSQIQIPSEVQFSSDMNWDSFMEEPNYEQKFFSKHYLLLLTTYWNPYSGIMYWYSNFNYAQFRLPLSIFDDWRFQINGQLVKQTWAASDNQGLLYFAGKPTNIFNVQTKRSTKVYLPEQQDSIAASITFSVIIDGEQKDDFNFMSQREIQILQDIDPWVTSVSSIIRTSFAFLSIFNMSYFIMSIIEFWNLALMYNFLIIKAVPEFVNAICSRMMNFFFSYNSFNTQINKFFTNTQSTEDFVDFSPLTSIEKINMIKNEHIWLAFVGATSNFMGNNADSLILITFSIIRRTLIYLVIKVFRKRVEKCSKVKNENFLFDLSLEILCFCPLIISSALEVMLKMGEANLMGKINSLLHITVIVLILVVPCVALIIKINQIQRSKKVVDKEHLTSLQIEKREMMVKILLNNTLPALIVLSNKIAFFVLISIVILIRVVVWSKHLKYQKWIPRFVNVVGNTVWVLFHCSFLLIFIIDNLPKSKMFQLRYVMKYCGYVILINILIGGFVDVLQTLYKFITEIVYRIKKILCSQPTKKIEKEQATTDFGSSVTNQLSFTVVVKNQFKNQIKMPQKDSQIEINTMKKDLFINVEKIKRNRVSKKSMKTGKLILVKYNQRID